MTTLEYTNKQLKKAKISLDKALKRAGTTQGEIDALREKIHHYETIIQALEEFTNKRHKT